MRCLSTTGQADYILTVMMRDIAAYERFLHATLFKLPGVTHVRSSIVLKEVKAEVRLPVAAPGEREAPSPAPAASSASRARRKATEGAARRRI